MRIRREHEANTNAPRNPRATKPHVDGLPVAWGWLCLGWPLRLSNGAIDQTTGYSRSDSWFACDQSPQAELPRSGRREPAPGTLQLWPSIVDCHRAFFPSIDLDYCRNR